jgi:hypothetical protein
MRRTGDKILDNSFNTGQIEHEHFHVRDMKISNEYADDYLNEYYDNEKYARLTNLLHIIEEITHDSKYSLKLQVKRKFPKAKLNDFFCFIVENVKAKDSTYTIVEMMIGSCEYLGCSYENMFKKLSLTHKEKILSELDSEYRILSKMNIKKLF